MGILLLSSWSLLTAASYYENGKLKILTPELPSRATQTSVVIKDVKNTNEVNWYTTEQGSRIGVTKTILVKWNDSSNSEELVKSMGFVKIEKLTQFIWELTIPENADVFLLAKALYEDSSTEFAHPNMIRERSMR